MGERASSPLELDVQLCITPFSGAPILNDVVHHMRAWHVPAYAAAQSCSKSSALRSCPSTAKQGGGKTRNNTRQGSDAFYYVFWGGNETIAVFCRQSQCVKIVSTRHRPPFITCSTGDKAHFFFERVKLESSARNLMKNDRMLERPSARLTTSHNQVHLY